MKIEVEDLLPMLKNAWFGTASTEQLLQTG